MSGNGNFESDSFPGDPAECNRAQGDPTQDLALWFALHTLTTRYWRDVDFNAGRAAHEFYQADGVFVAGKNRFEGRDNIRAFYAWRGRLGQTVTRHLISNVVVAKADGRSATAVGVMSLHRSDPLAAGAKAVVPILVADFTADCVCGNDGAWRFASHQVSPIFVSGDVPLSLAVDPSFLAAAEAS
jgi:hypothetical protein